MNLMCRMHVVGDQGKCDGLLGRKYDGDLWVIRECGQQLVSHFEQDK